MLQLAQKAKTAKDGEENHNLFPLFGEGFVRPLMRIIFASALNAEMILTVISLVFSSCEYMPVFYIASLHIALLYPLRP